MSDWLKQLDEYASLVTELRGKVLELEAQLAAERAKAGSLGELLDDLIGEVLLGDDLTHLDLPQDWATLARHAIARVRELRSVCRVPAWATLFVWKSNIHMRDGGPCDRHDGPCEVRIGETKP